MVKRLKDWFEEHYPDVIVGCSVVQLDLRVLQKNAAAAGVPLLLGAERHPLSDVRILTSRAASSHPCPGASSLTALKPFEPQLGGHERAMFRQARGLLVESDVECVATHA